MEASVAGGHGETTVALTPSPKEWAPTTFGQLADYINGYPFKPAQWQEEGLPIVRIAQLTNPTAPCDRYAGSLPDHYLIRDGDLIFSWSATLMTLRWNRGDAYLNQHLFRVVPRPGVSVEFLHHLIDFSLDALGGKAHGTTMRHIKRSDLLPFPVRVPPLSEQRRIAEVLDDIDCLIAGTQQTITKLDWAKEGLLADLMGCGVTDDGRLRGVAPQDCVPSGWDDVSLDEVGQWVSGGTPSKAAPSFWGGATPWVSPKDMKRLWLDTAADTLSDAGLAAGCRLVPRGSVLVVVRGMILAHTFPVCLAARPLVFNQDVKAIIPDERTSGEFVAYWLLANARRILALVSESTHGTKRIDMADLLAVRMPLPPRDEQERIVRIVSAHDAAMSSEQIALGKLRNLRRGMASDLLADCLTPNQRAAETS